MEETRQYLHYVGNEHDALAEVPLKSAMTSWCQKKHCWSLEIYKSMQQRSTDCNASFETWNPAPTPEPIICSLDFEMILRWFWCIWRFLIWNAALPVSFFALQVPTCLPCRSGEEMGGNQEVGRSALAILTKRIVFVQCLSISWSCLSKKLENWRIGSTIHPFSLSICTVVLATCVPHWICNTDPQGSQAAPRLQHQWGDSIPERWPLWAWRRLSSLSCFGLNV